MKLTLQPHKHLGCNSDSFPTTETRVISCLFHSLLFLSNTNAKAYFFDIAHIQIVFFKIGVAHLTDRVLGLIHDILGRLVKHIQII